MSKVNAIQLLKNDHQTVRKLLTQLTETTKRAAKTRPKLLEDIEKELKIHTQIEEEIFYPAFVKQGGEKEMHFEAKEEHRAVEDLVLPDLKNTDPTTDQFSGRAKVLRELVEHHADEEEKEMFPKARKLFSKKELEALGEQLEERKKALQEQLG